MPSGAYIPRWLRCRTSQGDIRALVFTMNRKTDAYVPRMPDEQRERHAGRDFWRGHLHGHDVVAVLSGIGKVAAATTATLLIERFGVNRIVFTGVAGGLGADVALGGAGLAAAQ